MACAHNVLPNFARTVQGPALIGLFFNLILYGTFLTQTQYYFSSYKRDSRRLKIFVVCLVIVETVNSVFAMYYTYDRLVNNFGDMNAQAVSNWVFGMGPVTNGIVAMLVQIFFSWRVRVLTNMLWVMIGIVFLAVVSCLATVTVFLVAAILVPSPTASAAQYLQPVVIVWLVSSVSADTMISTVLVYYLQRHKTGFVRTDDTINKIIRLTVQTGVITSVWAAVDLGVYLGDSTAHHLIFNLSLAKLYSNSLLSSLNAREGLMCSSTEYSTSLNGSHSTGKHKPPPSAVAFASPHVHPEVFIDIEAHEMRDPSPNGKYTLDTPMTGTNEAFSIMKPADAL